MRQGGFKQQFGELTAVSCRLTSGDFHGKLASLASLPVFWDLGSTPLPPRLFCAKRSHRNAIDRYTTQKLPGKRSRNRRTSRANRQSQPPGDRRFRLKQFDRSRIAVFGRLLNIRGWQLSSRGLPFSIINQLDLQLVSNPESTPFRPPIVSPW